MQVFDRRKIGAVKIDRVDRWNELDDNEKVVIVMDRVCRDEAVARAIEKCGRSEFHHHLPPPPHKP